MVYTINHVPILLKFEFIDFTIIAAIFEFIRYISYISTSFILNWIMLNNVEIVEMKLLISIQTCEPRR